MERRVRIIASLEKNLGETVGLFRSLNAEQLSAEVYTDGPKWTAMQIAAHLVTIEKSMQWLFNNLLSGGEGSPVDFDPDRFNLIQVPKLDGLSLDMLMDRFKAVRQETIAIVRGMTDEDLDRKGYHAFHGQGTLERFICWAYEHAQLHGQDLRKALNR